MRLVQVGLAEGDRDGYRTAGDGLLATRTGMGIPHTTKSRAFLDDLKAKGGEFKDLAAFCAERHWNKDAIAKWRRQVVGFKEEMDGITKHLFNSNGKTVEYVKRLDVDLDSALVKFITLWRANPLAEADAILEAGLEPYQISDARTTRPDFDAEYKRVTEIIAVQAQDVLRSSAIKGRKTDAARAVLEAEMGYKYGKRVAVDVNVGGTVTHTHALVEQRSAYWGDRFGRLTDGEENSQPINGNETLLPQSTIEDIIEVECTEMESIS